MDWETTMLSHGVKPWDVDACDAVWNALHPDLNEMSEETLKDYDPDYYFDKYEAPKLRSKPLDLNDKFDKILLQRRNAFINHAFDIFDTGIIKLKLSDLINTSTTKQQDIEISILNSTNTKKLICEYNKRIKQNNSEYNNISDDNSSSSSFQRIDEDQYPSMDFFNEYPLKSKWIDDNNNIHFEYFKLYDIDTIVGKVINLDKMNHPLCNNWCVEYQYEYNEKDDIFNIKSKTFDYDLFWSCSLYFHLFKTCGIINYDNHFKKIINQHNNNQNAMHQQNNKQNQIFYHNTKKDVIPRQKNKDKHVCTSWCEQEKFMDPQLWFADHGKKEMKSKPVDMNDPFYVEMINRKKCMILGTFKVIDRQNNDHLNIFENDNIKELRNRFKQNNEYLSYRIGSDELYRFIRNDRSVFDFKGYDDGHRCIAIWFDDDGKKHEEWFKLYPYEVLYNPASDGNISSIYWHVSWQLHITKKVEKYYDQNTFWTMATMFKVFGICGIKQIDEQFYDLRKKYKYLVHGYMNNINKMNNLSSKIPVSLCQIILKYYPFISGELV